MRPAAIAIVFNEQNEVLLLKRAYPQTNSQSHWGFPGGNLEGFEEPFDAAIRKTKKETNLDIWHLKRVKREQYIVQVGELLVHVYTTRHFENNIILSCEYADYVWVSLEQLDNYKLIPGSKELIEKAINL